MNETYIRARIDSELKENATQVLNKMGFTLSDGVRIFLMRVVEEQTLPFELKAPRALTISALRMAYKNEAYRKRVRR